MSLSSFTEEEEFLFLMLNSSKRKVLPRQKIPRCFRFIIKILVLPFVYVSLLCDKFVNIIFNNKVGIYGRCSKCGRCCQSILTEEPKSFISRLSFFWNTEINGFYRKFSKPIKTESGSMIVLGCRYLQDGRCENYMLRPKICRQWPKIDFLGNQNILEGCSYRCYRKK